jgi:hypothetical protein|tara:strand:+ start:513 stop:1208 length:696 start_codon:yes stop_codon:yes gene_type:complete
MGEEDVPHEQFWCEKQEKLLVRWAEKAAGYRWLHNHARLYYKQQHDYLSYPSIIIASITGVGGFAVLNPSGGDDIDSDMAIRIMVVQYFFAFLNVIGGILTSISKFGESANLEVAHSAMCKQYSKYYRNIDMEISLDVSHRVNIMILIKKCRQEYDRFLDEAPDIPSISIKAFNEAFPSKENKPDVCNGLSVIGCDDTRSKTSTNNIVSRWLGSLASIRRKSTDGAPRSVV